MNDLKVESLIPERFFERHREHRQLYTGNPRPRYMGKGLELVALRKDGTEFPVEVSLSPLEPGDGAFVAVDIRDISQRKAADQQTRLLQEELARLTRVATMGEFAGSVAHEINQPLTAIATNAQAARRYLDRPTPDTDKASEALTAVAEDAKRAGEVIHRLRGLFEKREPEESPLDINAIVRQIVTLLQSGAMAKDISVRLGLATNLPRVLGDGVLLQQVLLNLLLNGIEAMDDVAADRRTLTVETSIGDAGTVQIAVRDSGVGLSSEHLDRMFEPFYSTKVQGMGMGLAISRSIVESHGGRIWATPNADHGATFRVTLPAGEVASS